MTLTAFFYSPSLFRLDPRLREDDGGQNFFIISIAPILRANSQNLDAFTLMSMRQSIDIFLKNLYSDSSRLDLLIFYLHYRFKNYQLSTKWRYTPMKKKILNLALTIVTVAVGAIMMIHCDYAAASSSDEPRATGTVDRIGSMEANIHEISTRYETLMQTLSDSYSSSTPDLAEHTQRSISGLRSHITDYAQRLGSEIAKESDTENAEQIGEWVQTLHHLATGLDDEALRFEQILAAKGQKVSQSQEQPISTSSSISSSSSSTTNTTPVEPSTTKNNPNAIDFSILDPSLHTQYATFVDKVQGHDLSKKADSDKQQDTRIRLLQELDVLRSDIEHGKQQITFELEDERVPPDAERKKVLLERIAALDKIITTIIPLGASLERSVNMYDLPSENKSTVTYPLLCTLGLVGIALTVAAIIKYWQYRKQKNASLENDKNVPAESPQQQPAQEANPDNITTQLNQTAA